MVLVSTSTLELPAVVRTHRTPRPGGSLAERFPDIAAEWDAAGNSPLLASDVTYATGRVVSWHCPVGHGTYTRSVAVRTVHGHGCHECVRLRRAVADSAPKKGKTLADAAPAAAAGWDYDANYPLTPSDVAAHSNKKAFFVCPAGHGSHESIISSRTRRDAFAVCTEDKGSGFPKNGKTLAEAFPEIAATWDFEANYPLTPSDVAPRSNKKAFFICPAGHGSHESYISNRTAGNGCPVCGERRRIETGRQTRLNTRGSVADMRPELVADWSDKNSLTPHEVTPGSAQLIWWNCETGHEPFLGPVYCRARGKGCPECANIKRAAAIAYTGPKPGESLADLRPDLAAEWDFARNTLTPSDVGTNTDRVAFWACDSGHSYEQKIRSRCKAKERPCCRNERLAARKAALKS